MNNISNRPVFINDDDAIKYLTEKYSDLIKKSDSVASLSYKIPELIELSHDDYYLIAGQARKEIVRERPPRRDPGYIHPKLFLNKQR